MADEIQAPAQGQPATNEPGPVPYERFKEINERLKSYEAAAAKSDAEKKAAEEKQLAEQRKWQELYEKREAELKSERSARARLEVAAKKGLPVDLVDRLRGDTVEELEKDADALLALVAKKPEGAPGVPPPTRNGGRPAVVDYSKMSPKEIREHRAKTQ